jgi:CRP-like cAMP-binding protein
MPENLLLRCLSDEVRSALRPHFKEVKLSPGDVLAEVREKISSVYFPSSGAVSLIVEMSCGDTVETAMIGRDGAVNALASLDDTEAFSKAVVLLPGTALCISVERLRECAERYQEVRELLVRHVQVLIGEIQQAAACNIIDVVEARLARWLLRARDLAECDELPLTHDAMAQMLGVRRPSVSVVAGTLQRAGMIKHRRGHVQILDREALENSACECYATVRDHYRRLLHKE